VIIQLNNNLVVYMKTNDKGEYDKYWASNSVNNDIGKGQVKLDSNG